VQSLPFGKPLASGQAPHPDRSVQIVDGATGARWPIRLQPWMARSGCRGVCGGGSSCPTDEFGFKSVSSGAEVTILLTQNKKEWEGGYAGR